MAADEISVYLAGGLFTHGQLLGNWALAEAIRRVSRGRYVCTLPQDGPPGSDARRVRDQDLAAILAARAGLFCFEGAELDAGVVAEFLFARSLDRPAVILRTDFRTGGEALPDSDPWNLMCSFHPRTRVLRVDASALYREARRRMEAERAEEMLSHLYQPLAEGVVEALDQVLATPPTPLPAGMTRPMVEQWALRYTGCQPSAGAESRPASWAADGCGNEEREHG